MTQVALLYKNIVAVMQNLGHKVVAEGVETQEEIDLLKQWGVDLVQGYYYTKPLDSEQIIHKLEERCLLGHHHFYNSSRSKKEVLFLLLLFSLNSCENRTSTKN